MVDYHPVSFHFRVTPDLITNYPYIRPDGTGYVPDFNQSEDIKFQSVSGLSVQVETEKYYEYGQNQHPHVLAKKVNYPDLVLKRGIYLPSQSGFTVWCKKAFENMIFSPIDLTIDLLNEEHQVLMFWKVQFVWPKEWKVADLNAERGEVLIETLVLNYNRFEFRTP